MSERTLSVAPYGDQAGMDPSSGHSRSTGPQMASDDPSFLDLPNREVSSVLLPASDLLERMRFYDLGTISKFMPFLR